MNLMLTSALIGVFCTQPYYYYTVNMADRVYMCKNLRGTAKVPFVYTIAYMIHSLQVFIRSKVNNIIAHDKLITK